MSRFVPSVEPDANDLWAFGGGLVALGGVPTIVLDLLRDEIVVVVAGSAAMMATASVFLLVATNGGSSS